MKPLWPHQQRGLDELRPLVERGKQRVCLHSPTGGGKTRMMREVIGWGARVNVYTNRIMLFDQLRSVLESDGVNVGAVAAGHEGQVSCRVQLCMTQTADARMSRKGSVWSPPACDIAIVDECHNEKSARMTQIIEHHTDDGATVVGLTATPIGIGHLYDHLVIAGTNSELRKCGAHVPAITYAPSEIESKMIRKVKAGEDEFFSPIIRQAVFGQVIESWKQLNPDQTPTILFAPGVGESRWFANELNSQGIPAAHIDGDRVVLHDEELPSTSENRELVRQAVVDGDVKIVCNRFVLREGVDIPELQHCIFATPFGSLTSYLQAGGRVLRSHPSHDRVVVQDHGGNWWRHGSLNSDREWSMDKTDKQMVAERAEQQRTRTAKGEPDPIVCPKCSALRTHGQACHSCGHISARGDRQVIQIDGALKTMRGDLFPPRKISSLPEDVKTWQNCFYRMKNSGRTFKQAMGLFCRETQGRWPDPSWPCMPRNPADASRRINDVPYTDVISKREFEGDQSRQQDQQQHLRYGGVA